MRISRDTTRDDRRTHVLILLRRRIRRIASKRFTPDAGTIEDLCASDALSPVQFHEMWSGTVERSAEFNLALAVLEQALEDLRRHRGAIGNEQRRLYRQAESWVHSDDRRWPYSFVNVCEALDLHSERIRTLILADAFAIDVDVRTPASAGTLPRLAGEG